MDIRQEIKSLVPGQEEYLCGFAGMGGLLADKFRGFDFAVVLGKKLDDKVMDSIVSGPNRDYLEHYRETNKALSALAHHISRRLEFLGIGSLIIEPTLSSEELYKRYYQTLRYDFSHKMAATRAGVGWIGKTGLFISEKFGPRLRLATILLDRSLDCAGEPVEESRCGKCNLCVEQCPAGAANGRLWNVKMEREDFFDAFKCREMCLQLTRQSLGKPSFICGICAAVCPIGKKKNKQAK